ncbi:hypothetical protein GL213_02915 [Halogeometricum borinquense]|uniref:DUF7974 domain-containing protein n=1 Tax=Halogeometricum borinquense TaxID=60847 RepID=A0A6C0UK09_9EURY|nr:hypothetical protein [Halogeometricum borinquense]QIB75842.1 hypothetical protein G3I44_17100 [Halogeometricum borinquense]QIQ75576.1 hypothetical protein GL213_02915 [Halogeometricum borinquense]
MSPADGPTGKREDRHGFDDTKSPITDALGKFVPQAIVKRSLSLSVRTDKETYAPGEPVELTVEIENRLPLPVAVHTPTHRLWGWTVDGELEASDERVYLPESPSKLSFRAGERKVLTQTWNGLLKRVGDDDTPTRWVEPTCGVHEIGAYLALDGTRPEDTTEIRIVD